jgi:hypothetical protein
LQAMFICNHCHAQFPSPLCRATPPDYQMQAICPECGDEDIELAKRCPRCGRYYTKDEFDGFDFCPSCVNEITKTSTLKQMMQYLEERNLEHEFYVNFLHNADDRDNSRELTDICKDSFKRDFSLTSGISEYLTEQLREFCTGDDGIDDFIDWYSTNEMKGETINAAKG